RTCRTRGGMAGCAPPWRSSTSAVIIEPSTRCGGRLPVWACRSTVPRSRSRCGWSWNGWNGCAAYSGGGDERRTESAQSLARPGDPHLSPAVPVRPGAACPGGAGAGAVAARAAAGPGGPAGGGIAQPGGAAVSAADLCRHALPAARDVRGAVGGVVRPGAGAARARRDPVCGLADLLCGAVPCPGVAAEHFSAGPAAPGAGAAARLVVAGPRAGGAHRSRAPRQAARAVGGSAAAGADGAAVGTAGAARL